MLILRRISIEVCNWNRALSGTSSLTRSTFCVTGTWFNANSRVKSLYRTAGGDAAPRLRVKNVKELASLNPVSFCKSYHNIGQTIYFFVSPFLNDPYVSPVLCTVLKALHLPRCDRFPEISNIQVCLNRF